MIGTHLNIAEIIRIEITGSESKEVPVNMIKGVGIVTSKINDEIVSAFNCIHKANLNEVLDS
ncbi:MAG: hypothetical protein RLN90_00385 [Balneolaceae bacterium]